MASPSDLTYEIWSDGACAHKTTGAGGYAAVLIARRSDGSTAKQWEVSDGELGTTNNQMELKAVITGLRALPAPARVCIFIDSTYVMKNFGDWLERWQSNGWRTADGKQVKNRDLWEQLSAEVACRKVKWVQVPGHAGPARRLAVAGAVGEVIAHEVMERRLGPLVSEPYREGRAHRFSRASAALSASGAALIATGRRSRTRTIAGAAAVLAGAVCQRWAVYSAGFPSARDPKYTVEPQRARLAERSAAG